MPYKVGSAKMYRHQNYVETGTRLTLEQCSSSMEAPKIFGQRTSGRLPIVLTPTKACCVSIPEDVYAIKTSHGQEKGLMEPGHHFLLPWEEVGYVVTKHYTPFDTPVKDCPTKDNVMVKIDIFLIFRIVDPIKFVYGLGPAKLTELLRAAQEEAVRNLARSIRHADIYDLMNYEETEMVIEMNRKFQRYGVEIADVTIENVALPSSVSTALQNESVFKAKDRLRVRQHKFELLQTQNTEYLEQLRIDHDNAKRAESEQGRRVLAEVKKELSEIKAGTEKVVAEISEAQNAEVEKIDAGANLEAGRKAGQKEKVLAEIGATAHREAAALSAGTEAYVQGKLALSDLKVKENEAQAVKLMAAAESKAAKQLQAKREYDAAVEKVDVLGGIAWSASTVGLVGKGNGNVVVDMQASRTQARALH